MKKEIHECIHKLFEKQVIKTPNNKAIVHNDSIYTYQEVNERANQLAHHLIDLGLKPGNLVAVCCERSPLLIIALFAVQKAGGAYVPLDPEYPDDRLKYMLDDCEPKVLLCEKKLEKNLKTQKLKTKTLYVDISKKSSIFLTAKKENPLPSVTGHDYLYIIYTSGSTGKPKGSIVYHRGFHNLLKWYCRCLDFGRDSRPLLLTSFSFDLTQKNIFAPLVCGGCIFLPKIQHYDANILLEEIDKYSITSVNCTPSAFYGLLADPSLDQLKKLASLQYVVLGGEPILTQRLRKWIESDYFNAEIINSYGPTECTDVVSFYTLEDVKQYVDNNVPIGRPIDNTELFIMDKALRELPPGQEGELCIAGGGVGGGYLNRPEYTAERFCRHPLDKLKIVYRTGDRARFLGNGNIEYLGRIDQQVKVRGFRIEPGEIETKLELVGGIQEAVVLAKPDGSGDNRLVAYLVRTAQGPHKNISEIRSRLQRDLPDFMLPTAWVFLDKMPLSPNGKLDRKALPCPGNDRPELSQAYLQATTPLEKFLAGMWKQLLNLDRVGMRDRFFELGGTSVKAIRFMAQLGKELEQAISIAGFFAAPTIEGFIRFLDRNHLSALQKRFPDHRPLPYLWRRPVPIKTDKPAESLGDIAIIGFSGRFPGADDVDSFWTNLRSGVESVEFAGNDQLRLNGVNETDIEDVGYSKAYFSASDLDGFDAEFFGYQPREVELMDPQHRLFLELAWTALDNAGYSDPNSRQGRIGVYGGAGRDAYLHNYVSKHPDYKEALGEFFINLGNDKNFPVSRIAYKLNLTGPAITIQTACSTSGVALHLACQSLRLRECEMALVGGCRILSPFDIGYLHVEGGPFSEDGHLRTFDAKATGMVRGNGGAFLVIKCLKDALRDGDCIRGIIRSTAINNDGEARIGFTAPGVEGQEEVIRTALEQASVDPESITLVEAHGTATALGDPIEVTALTNAFRHYTDKKRYCMLGSVKPNVGHLDAGAANTSIIKILLAMEHAEIPPSLNFKQPNPNVNFADSPFIVADCLKKWETGGLPRRAGVSSFGLGGTNFHAILEQAPPRESDRNTAEQRRSWQILTLSSKSAVSLNANVAGLQQYTRHHPEQILADLAYSINSFRPALSHRAVLVCPSDGDPKKLHLESVCKNITSEPESLVFLFPAEMRIPAAQLRILLDTEPQLHQFIDECCTLVLQKGKCSDNDQRIHLLQTLSESEHTFILQYALSRLWIDWGVAPTAVYSSGIGKLCASCIAGIVGLADAFSLLKAIESYDEKAIFELLLKLEIQPPEIPFLTEVSENWTDGGPQTSADFWLCSEEGNEISTQAFKVFKEQGVRNYLQITPGLSLPGDTEDGAEKCKLIVSLPENSDDPAKGLTEAVGQLWLSGLPLDWKRYYAGQKLRRVPLPSFRFNRRRFWLDLPDAGPRIITISADSEAELRHAAALWTEYLSKNSECDLKQLSVAEENAHRPFRQGIVALNSQQAGEILAENHPQSVHTHGRSDLTSPIFMFPGGGSQYLRMGHGLYRRYGDFRYSIDEGLALFGAHTGYDLKRVWFAAEHERDWALSELKKPSVQLPAIFILEMALAKLWMNWGVSPTALIGHSLGENSAACLAGVMSFEETLGLVILRGRLFEKIEEGGMLSVSLSAKVLMPYLAGEIDIAVINGPEQCTVSGSIQLLKKVQLNLEKDEIESNLIPIATAAHSRLLDPVLHEFEAYLRRIDLKQPKIPMISNLTGGWLSHEDAVDPAYWVKHLRNTVQFCAGLETLMQHNRNSIFFEIGPGKSLCSLIKAQYPESRDAVIPSLRHQREQAEDQLFFLNSVCRTLLSGTYLDRSRIAGQHPGLFLHLPARPPITDMMPMPAASPLIQLPISLGNNTPSISDHGRTATMSRKELIVEKVKSIIEEMSGISKSTIGSETTFLNMGFDSLFLTQLNSRLKKVFKIKITLKQVFGDAPTISELSNYIDTQLPPDTLRDELEVQSSPAPYSSHPTPSPSFPGTGDTPVDLQQAIALHIQTSNALLGYLQGRVAVQQQAPVQQPAASISVEKKSPSEFVGANHGPYAPLQKTIQTEFTDRQKAYLFDFIDKYQSKTQNSKALAAEIRPNYADPRTVMGFKTLWKELTYSIAAERSKGSRVWDVDGNEYVDCMGGFGAILFGHAPDFVLDAVRKQLDSSIDYGPQSAMAGRVAGLFCEMTGMERVSFCNTGSEADLAAIRIARTVTGNDLIVCFQGAYHGIFDEVLARRTPAVGGEYRNQPVAPGIPDTASQNILILDYDDKRSLEIIRERSEEIAGVIVEPVQSRHPEIQPKEFLQKLRALTAELGIPLIFDEIITGFRLHPQGAQGWFGVKADLACYGKVIGGGFPIGVIAGKREYMDALDGGHWNFGDDSFPEVGVTYFAGTFVRHPVALAATEAVLLKLKEEGEALQRCLNKKTAIFAETVSRRYRQLGVPIELVYFGSAFFIRYKGNADYEGLFWHHLRYFGAHHIFGNRPCFLTTAHTDEDMAALFESFIAAAIAMQEGGLLPKAGDHKEDFFPWTSVQVEIWLAMKISEQSAAAYNEQVMFQVDTSLDQVVLELAIDRTVNRHSSLRAVISEDETGLLIKTYMCPEFNYMDLSGYSEAGKSEKVEQLALENGSAMFDFKNGPLLRALLIKLEDTKFILCVSVSHLVCDGLSLEIVMEDIAGYYTSICQSRSFPHHQVPSLADFVKKDNENLKSAEFEESKVFWMSMYKESLPPELDLPLDRPRPAFRSYKGERHHYYLEDSLTKPMREFARENGCTSFVLLLSTYVILLKYLSRQNDIVVGIPAAGQPFIGMPGIVAHAVSLLPLRVRIDESQKFIDFLSSVRDQFMDAKDNQGFSYGELLKSLPIPRNVGRQPLFSVSFNVDMAFNPLFFDEVKAQFIPAPRQLSKTDLLFTLTDEGDRVLIEVDRNADILDAATIDRWVGQFQALLREILQSPHSKVKDISVLSDDDRQKIFREWNVPIEHLSSNSSFISLFEKQTNIAPDRIALHFKQKSLTYLELDQRANQYANYFRSRGVIKDDLVGICLERSERMVTALLGILKCGAAYVPLEPNFPVQRLMHMVEDSCIKHLVVESAFSSKFDTASLNLIQIDAEDADVIGASTVKPEVNIIGSDTAYVIFTSGSTGRPKGVVIQHKAVLNLLCALRSKPGITADDVYLSIVSLSFDPSVIDLFLPLITGASVVIADSEQCRDGLLLKSLLEITEPSIMNATPATWRFLVDLGWRPKNKFKALCGGEELLPDLALELAGRVTELWNMYGPTEATVATCCFRIPQTGSPIRIGRPLANNHLYILNGNGLPLPSGIPGELHIGGSQVASGYLNRPDLTAEKFISDPFSDDPKARLYKTGDIALFHSDGAIEYLGRMDHQVKIRGNRVELGEIEAVLSKARQVRQCVVALWRKSDQDQRLIAFIIPEDLEEFDTLSLRKYLRQYLPDYMMPQHYELVERFPLTSSGKIDRLMLLNKKPVFHSERTSRHIAPETEIEKQLAELWKDIIGIEKVGVHDNFFDLGGHSLLSMKLIDLVYKSMGVQITPGTISLGTLGQIAHEISENLNDTRAVMRKKYFLN
jgi:amino acid adenylation domain-containing protein